ncbi:MULTISPECIES: hypothetical protein [Halorussus]|uniref:hypothetical protein n=1 Tax=Halorussus TaxID=1070314 RepID=UPI000E2186B0|nr:MULTISPECIES: hypothetical protein [Halorussus]NHN59599.1 hypothetical protein [Halorussus sp. JP-T4]
MSTASNADAGSDAESSAGAVSESDSRGGSNGQSEPSSASMLDRLATAGRVVWWSFLGVVVVFTLIPVVGLWLGAVPFAAPPVLPYFALVGFALVGAAALIGAAIYDV